MKLEIVEVPETRVVLDTGERGQFAFVVQDKDKIHAVVFSRADAELFVRAKEYIAHLDANPWPDMEDVGTPGYREALEKRMKLPPINKQTPSPHHHVLNVPPFAEQHMPKSPIADLAEMDAAIDKMHKLLEASKAADAQGIPCSEIEPVPADNTDELLRSVGIPPLVYISKVFDPADWNFPPQGEDVQPDVVLGGEGFIWNDRMVKVEDGLFWLSAKGKYEDFDTNVLDSGSEAFAGNVAGEIRSASKIDDRRLKINSSGGTFLMIDHDGRSCHYHFTIDPYKPS